MAKYIKIRKGLTISLKGEAEKVLTKLSTAQNYALKPDDFPYLIPQLLVNENEQVLAGTSLFCDKFHPEIRYASPISGTITAIVRGEKRRLLAVVVTPSATQEYLKHQVDDVANMTREQLISLLLASGVWPFIKQRPYGIVANPIDTPKAIFISGFDSAPLAADIDFTLTGEADSFQKGIDVLKKLSGKIYLGLNDAVAATSIFHKVKNVEKIFFTGPHPAGNVGIQIHHVCPVNKGEKIWTIAPHHIVSIGRLMVKGIYDVSKVVALAGSEVKRPRYFRMIAGASLTSTAEYVKTQNNPRYISGNVLTGNNTGANGHLGFYDNLISVISEGDKREFLGWANPLRLHRYSVSRSYLSWMLPNKVYTLDTNMNGGKRAFVVNGEYEKMLPMDIYPVYLLKAILSKNLEKMEQLGIYEVIGEDLALCEFVCTSKVNVQEILREGIGLMIKEG